MRAINEKKWFAVALFVHGHAMLHGQLGYEFGYRKMNAGEVAAAEALIACHYDRPGVWMSNVLCFHYKHCLPPRTGGDGTGPKALPRANTSSTTPPPSSLRLHPNPTQAWVAVDYELQPNAANAQLRVKDGTGRVLHAQALAAPGGQVVLDTRAWAQGLYTLELLQDGQRTQMEKLVVQ